MHTHFWTIPISFIKHITIGSKQVFRNTVMQAGSVASTKDDSALQNQARTKKRLNLTIATTSQGITTKSREGGDDLADRKMKKPTNKNEG